MTVKHRNKVKAIIYIKLKKKRSSSSLNKVNKNGQAHL